jgi:serine/threonine-protein kinase
MFAGRLVEPARLFRRPVSDTLRLLQASLGTSYTIERELGGGGMARVYVAVEHALGRQVVI